MRQGQEIEFRGKRYKVSELDIVYGGRVMFSAFRWIKSAQRFSTIAYIVGTTEELGE